MTPGKESHCPIDRASWTEGSVAKGMRPGIGVSDLHFHELAYGQCQNTDHQVAECFAVAPHTQVAGSEFVLEPSVHPFHGRALGIALCLRKWLADRAPGLRLPDLLLFALRRTARVRVSDRHMPERKATGPDLLGVIVAVHHVVQAADAF